MLRAALVVFVVAACAACPADSTPGADAGQTIVDTSPRRDDGVGADADIDSAGRDAGSALARCPQVTPVAPPAALGLDPFYTRYVDGGGIPIVGSAKVPDAAFAQAYYTLANMLRARPCVRKALALSGIRLGIIGRDEVTTDMPEYSDLNTAFPSTDWNTRGRGYGATLVRPLVSGAVENILREPNDKWLGELILLHELAHTIFEHGVAALADGDARGAELAGLYSDALAKGLWNNTYAASAAREYWAEGVQDFYDNNLQASPPNGIHNHVNTRVELAQYDPGLAAFIAKVLDPTAVQPYCDPQGSASWVDPTPSDPLAASCSFVSGYLVDDGCSGGPTKSPAPPASASAELLVVNRSSDKALEISWLDENGLAVARGSVSPRGQRTLSSAPGQVFRLSRAGACVGVYTLAYPAKNIVASR